MGHHRFECKNKKVVEAEDDSNTTLHVSNLPGSVIEKDIRELFSMFGPILEVCVPKNNFEDF